VAAHTFAEAFRTTTGQPPHRRVQERRIERAKLTLRGRKLRIAEIALQTGFSNQATPAGSSEFAVSRHDQPEPRKHHAEPL
jgi:AraC-like DNA-binding protein